MKREQPYLTPGKGSTRIQPLNSIEIEVGKVGLPPLSFEVPKFGESTPALVSGYI